MQIILKRQKTWKNGNKYNIYTRYSSKIIKGEKYISKIGTTIKQLKKN